MSFHSSTLIFSKRISSLMDSNGRRTGSMKESRTWERVCRRKRVVRIQFFLIRFVVSCFVTALHALLVDIGGNNKRLERDFICVTVNEFIYIESIKSIQSLAKTVMNVDRRWCESFEVDLKNKVETCSNLISSVSDSYKEPEANGM